MLEFLWPGASKSGQQTSETATGRGKDVTSLEQSKGGDAKEEDQRSIAPAQEESAKDARKSVGDKASSEEGERREPEATNPLAPPGAFAESTVDAGNVQDEMADSPLPEGESRKIPLLAGRRRGKRLVKKEESKAPALTAPQRLLLLDTWRRSALPASDFAALVGISRHTLYAWKKRFDQQGPAGLLEQPRGGPKGSRLPELTKRTIIMLKAANPDWGCQRISDLLGRGPALPASPGAVARVLHEAGYELEEVTTRP